MNRGEKIGLVGPNGAGKTTIFRLIAREEEPDDGQIAIDRGVAIGYFSQDVGEMKGQSVLEAALDGAGAVSEAARELHELEHALADPERADELDALVERFGEVQARFEALGGYGLEARAREVLAGLGFAPEQVDGDVGALSGGWKMRVALARILLMQPDALLLDEPTNHLDLESILWLEDLLRDFEGALVMTSHDREFLNRMVAQDRRDRRRRADHLLRATTTSTSASARSPSASRRRSTRASRRCSRRRRRSSRASRRARATPRRCSRA